MEGGFPLEAARGHSRAIQKDTLQGVKEGTATSGHGGKSTLQSSNLVLLTLRYHESCMKAVRQLQVQGRAL